MNVPVEAADAAAKPELFPHDWLFSAPVQMVINVAAVGICLLRAMRPLTPDGPDQSGFPQKITDFQYVMVNPVQQSLLKLSAEDVLGQPLVLLSPDVVQAGILDRLRQVVDTGRPGGYTEVYQLDGTAGRFNQVYLKSGDGVLMLVQDVSYCPLSLYEQRQQAALLRAINTHQPKQQGPAAWADKRADELTAVSHKRAIGHTGG